jgi:hypothetical protein
MNNQAMNNQALNTIETDAVMNWENTNKNIRKPSFGNRFRTFRNKAKGFGSRVSNKVRGFGATVKNKYPVYRNATFKKVRNVRNMAVGKAKTMRNKIRSLIGRSNKAQNLTPQQEEHVTDAATRVANDVSKMTLEEKHVFIDILMAIPRLTGQAINAIAKAF